MGVRVFSNWYKIYAGLCAVLQSIERGLRMLLLLLRWRSSVLLALGRLYWELQSGVDKEGRLSIRPDLLMADVMSALGLTSKIDLLAVFGAPHLPGDE